MNQSFTHPLKFLDDGLDYPSIHLPFGDREVSGKAALNHFKMISIKLTSERISRACRQLVENYARENFTHLSTWLDTQKVQQRRLNGGDSAAALVLSLSAASTVWENDNTLSRIYDYNNSEFGAAQPVTHQEVVERMKVIHSRLMLAATKLSKFPQAKITTDLGERVLAVKQSAIQGDDGIEACVDELVIMRQRLSLLELSVSVTHVVIFVPEQVSLPNMVGNSLLCSPASGPAVEAPPVNQERYLVRRLQEALTASCRKWRAIVSSGGRSSGQDVHDVCALSPCGISSRMDIGDILGHYETMHASVQNLVEMKYPTSIRSTGVITLKHIFPSLESAGTQDPFDFEEEMERALFNDLLAPKLRAYKVTPQFSPSEWLNNKLSGEHFNTGDFGTLVRMTQILPDQGTPKVSAYRQLHGFNSGREDAGLPLFSKAEVIIVSQAIRSRLFETAAHLASQAGTVRPTEYGSRALGLTPHGDRHEDRVNFQLSVARSHYLLERSIFKAYGARTHPVDYKDLQKFTNSTMFTGIPSSTLYYSCSPEGAIVLLQRVVQAVQMSTDQWGAFSGGSKTEKKARDKLRQYAAFGIFSDTKIVDVQTLYEGMLDSLQSALQDLEDGRESWPPWRNAA